MKSNRPHLIGIAVCAACLILLTQANAEDAFAPARVMDISDRAYEPAVTKLIHEAKDTITMSMYTVSVGAKEPNPLSLLLDDLLDARKRGVAVTIYLNTKFRNGGADLTNMENNPSLKKMKDAGVAIELLSPYKRLHDKLIVVDSRYVVEGSTNWSISALRDNYESATLIDSPELARLKLARLATLPLGSEKSGPAEEEPRRPVYLEGLPADIVIPQALVTDKRYFAAMTGRGDERTMDAYLILKARSI